MYGELQYLQLPASNALRLLSILVFVRLNCELSPSVIYAPDNGRTNEWYFKSNKPMPFFSALFIKSIKSISCSAKRAPLKLSNSVLKLLLPSFNSIYILYTFLSWHRSSYIHSSALPADLEMYFFAITSIRSRSSFAFCISE